MGWSQILFVAFKSSGELDLAILKEIPEIPGIYAIATKLSNGNHVLKYVGRSGKSIRQRLLDHLTGRVNKRISDQINFKQQVLSSPQQGFSVAYFPTAEDKLWEAAYLDVVDKIDLPLMNMVRALLPHGWK